MAKDWIKSKQSELVAQCQDVSAKITAAPASYSLLPADAVALAALVTAFVTAYGLWADPATKTAVVTEQKNLAKDNLIALMRSYGRRISANPNISDDLKVGLGLNIRDNPSPVPAPSSKPVLTVLSVSERTVRLKIADENTPNKRAKPAGATEYEIFTHAGDSAPADISLWTYQGQGTKATVDVTVADSVASGSVVWIIARWCSRRGLPGPKGSPVNAVVVGNAAEAE